MSSIVSPLATPKASLASAKIKPSVLVLLALSAAFLLSLLYSSHVSTAAAKQALAHSPRVHDAGGGGADGVDTGEEEATVPAAASLLSAVNSSVDGAGEPRYEVDAEEQCDMAAGRWVKEPRGSVYTNTTCAALPDSKNCLKYGKDAGYLYWRWQPDGCELPRFDPRRFLRAVRGKTLAFIGDSLARNQAESLLCLLSQAEPPADVAGDAADKFRTWRFPAHNFTLKVMWTEFYVAGVQRFVDGTPSLSFDIHLDKINTNWSSQLPGLDFAVLNGGNWFFRTNYLYENGAIVGCVNCWERKLTDFGMAYAVRQVLRKALASVGECRGCKPSLVTLVRTYTPSHFEGGSWFDGGHCNRTAPLRAGEVDVNSVEWELRNVQREEVRRAREVFASKRFGAVDVTRAMMLRADGHIGGNYDRRWSARSANDCLHWCLPGPVDMWNDMLLHRIQTIAAAAAG